VVVVGSWVLVRAAIENDFCWTTQSSNAFLLIKIPIIISILVSAFFASSKTSTQITFLNVVLFDEKKKYDFHRFSLFSLFFLWSFFVYLKRVKAIIFDTASALLLRELLLCSAPTGEIPPYLLILFSAPVENEACQRLLICFQRKSSRK